MTNTMRIALAQVNPTVGDVAANVAMIREVAESAREAGADLVVFPELVVSGYPPEDLVLRPVYAEACRAAVDEIATATQGGPALLIGSPWPADGAAEQDPRPYNAAILCADGEIAAVRRKEMLPNYGVFDEPRTFRPADPRGNAPVLFKGVQLGLLVCEDIWYAEPAAHLAAQGADLFIAPHGSPYRMTAGSERQAVARARVEENNRPLIFVNQVGGQDELVFDGGAFVLTTTQNVYAGAPFETGLLITDWRLSDEGWQCTNGPAAAPMPELEQVYRATVMGTRDYVRKSGFEKIVLGLSGGIDSAMVAAIAADALGPDNVHCVMLPSRYTSSHSLEDAAACATALGVRLDTIEIEPGVVAFDEMLAPLFAGTKADLTEENIQSRLRGGLLMALSNKFGGMVLTTGNKSEMAVGYATLYGDMNGGYNPLKDLYKTEVFELARWRNAHNPDGVLGPKGEVIPDRIITKPPSAELREDQRDDDSLPPYDVLDAILRGLVEQERSVSDLEKDGFEPGLVKRVQHLLLISEYKRRQSPPGPKIGARNFGRDRRYPIVNRWRDPVA